MIFLSPSGEQHTYRCLSCSFSTMTISQLKEHSLRDHGEVLTLSKLRAATQAAHAAIRHPRMAPNTEHSHLQTDGKMLSVSLSEEHELQEWLTKLGKNLVFFFHFFFTFYFHRLFLFTSYKAKWWKDVLNVHNWGTVLSLCIHFAKLLEDN